MKKEGIWRNLMLGGVLIFSVLYVLPTFIPGALPGWYTDIFEKRLGYGLDLQGGLELRYTVDHLSAIEGNMLKVRDGFEIRLVEALAQKEGKIPATLSDDDKKVYEERFQVSKDSFTRLVLTFKDEKDGEIIDEDLVKSLDDRLVFAGSGKEFIVELPPKSVQEIRDSVVEQTLDIIRKRVEAFGLVEPDVRRAGETEIDVQLPGVDKSKMDFVRERIGQTAQLTFRMVDHEAQFFANKKSDVDAFKSANPQKAPTLDWVAGADPYLRAVNKSEIIAFTKTVDVPDDHLVSYEYVEVREKGVVTDMFWRTHYLYRPVEVSGDRVTRSFTAYDEKGEPFVSLEFDRRGASEFETTTRNNVGNDMAILLDDEVSSAPNIKEAISGGRARITMGGSRPPQEILKDSQALVTVLTHGAYKAPVHKVHDYEVGPSLGEDTVNAGVMAMLVGSVIVVIFMLIYYRIAGIVANIALLLNVILILAILVAFNAALTLPGMAGIILTIGMAVDANVIINERVREEIRAGRTLRAAIQTGYSRAFWTVFDANITTALAGFILLNYTTGPLHGFAVTLLIGIACSMFTAVFITRRIFEMLLDRGLTELKV